MLRGESHIYRRILLSLLWTIALVCLLFFEFKGIWTDEGFRLYLMNGGRNWGQQLAANDFASYGDVLVALGPWQYQPLFFLLGNTLFRAVGHTSELLLRFLNVLFLFGSIAGLLRLFRGWPAAAKLFLVLLFAFNGFLIENVMQIREYPLYLMLVIWTTVFYFEMFDEYGKASPLRFWIFWVVYVLLGILGFYTHPYFVFLLVAQAVFVFWRSDRTLSFAIRIYAALAAMFLGALPWILYLLRKFPGRMDPGNYTAGKPQTLTYLLECLRVGFRSVLTYHDSFSAALDVPAFIRVFLDSYAILVFIAIVFALGTAFRRVRETDPRVLFALLSVLVFLGYQSAYFFWKDTMSTWSRYFIGNYFGTMVLAAFAFKVLAEYLRTQSMVLRRGSLAAVIGVTVLASTFQLYNYYRYPFVDTGMNALCNWDEIGTKLAQHVRPADTVVYYNPLQGWTLSPRFKTPATEIDYWTAKLGNAPRTDVIWFVDTHVARELLNEAYAAVEKSGYRKSAAVKLGCLADLTRFDRASGRTPVPEQPVTAPGLSSTVIEAEKFIAGNAVGDSASIYGIGIGVLTSPAIPAWAEYDVRVPRRGKYEIRVRYASATSRPLVLTINGAIVMDRFCDAPTGGYSTTNQQWFSAGEVELPAGVSRMKLESKLPFPHVDKIAFVPR